MLEYEYAAKRQARAVGLTYKQIEDVLDYLCSVGNRREIFFLWRPFLADPRDDLVLELAVESGSHFIVTYNQGDFVGAEQFGIETITARDFLRRIGEIP